MKLPNWNSSSACTDHEVKKSKATTRVRVWISANVSLHVHTTAQFKNGVAFGVAFLWDTV